MKPLIENFKKFLNEDREEHKAGISAKIDRLRKAAEDARRGIQNMESGAQSDMDLMDVRSTNAYFSKQVEIMNLEEKIQLLVKQLAQLSQDNVGQLERGD